MERTLTLAVEGATDVAVARRLLDEANLLTGPEYIKSGKAALDRSLHGYNNAAQISRWLVLRDLDHDAECAPELRRRLLPSPSAHMRLHIPVRAIEAWLLADAEAISQCLSVSPAKVPNDPDHISDPKSCLVELARRSRKRVTREALVPRLGSTAKVGPGYSAFVIEFAADHWRPQIAATRSESLARLRKFLRVISQET